MIRSYLKIAWRNLTKNFTYSITNIIGLAIGMACCFLIGLYIRYELSYESFHENRHEVYRYVPRSGNEGELAMQTYTPAGMGPYLADAFHEVKAFTRLAGLSDRPLFRTGTKVLTPGEFMAADSTFFQVFSFPLIYGDAKTALSRPLTIVISKSIADAFFPGEDPVGKSIEYNRLLNFEITGVCADPPSNSHLQFSYIASFVSMPVIMDKVYGWRYDAILTDFGAWNYNLYFQIPSGDIADLQYRMTQKLYERENPGKTLSRTDKAVDWLQPLTEIHFTRNIKGDTGGTGDIGYIYIFSSVAVFVLLIACFNFMNLSTALALRRAKEVGLRKTLGAVRSQLINQFLGEAFILVTVAFIIAFQMLELSLPLFNKLMDTKLEFNWLDDKLFLGAILLTGLATAILAGSYPAFYLSSFHPSSVLKGDRLSGGNSGVRKFLTIAQFGIATFMLTGTLVVHQQMTYMKQASLGFNKEQVVWFMATSAIYKQYDAFKQQLLSNSGVRAVTVSNGVPGLTLGHWRYNLPDREDGSMSINTIVTGDYDYMDVLGLQLAAGRKLSRDYATDDSLAYIINETAVRSLGLENPVGTPIVAEGQGHGVGQIVGVVKDFHFRSLQHTVDPLVIRIDHNTGWLISVKLTAGNTQQTLDFIRREWTRLAPEQPFEYTFLDESYDKLYRTEERTGALMTTFSILAILVACLGLLGLTSFLTQLRRREIGIRKVLGASIQSVVRLLSWDFVKLVLIGFVIVTPVAWYAAHKWLESFAYKITVSPLVFIAAGGVITLFAIITVSYQAYRASVMNPAEVLKE